MRRAARQGGTGPLLRWLAGRTGATAMGRVYVIEGPPRVRGQLVVELADVADGAWIVPCPVYADHLFMLAPVDCAPAPGPSSRRPPAGSERAVPCPCGKPPPAMLRRSMPSPPYAAAPNGRPRSWPTPTWHWPSGPLRRPGPFLSPIRTHRVRRAQDPGSAELLATAASWLSFHSRATAHLNIHRNTLSARLTCIQELFGLVLQPHLG